MCTDLGIEAEPRDDHAAYIASWLKALKNDKRTIFQAASHAEKAVGFLHSKQPKAKETAENEDVSAAALAALRSIEKCGISVLSCCKECGYSVYLGHANGCGPPLSGICQG